MYNCMLACNNLICYFSEDDLRKFNLELESQWTSGKGGTTFVETNHTHTALIYAPSYSWSFKLS